LSESLQNHYISGVSQSAQLHDLHNLANHSYCILLQSTLLYNPWGTSQWIYFECWSNFSDNKMIGGKTLKDSSASARNDLVTGKSTWLIGLSVHKYIPGQEQLSNTLSGNLWS